MTLLDRDLAPPTDQPDGGEEALIKEARRLRRRRWMIGTASAALAAAAAGFLIAGGGAGNHGRSAVVGRSDEDRSSAGTKVSVSSLHVSGRARYEELEVVNDKLVLSGGPDGATPFVSASNARGAARGCHTAVLNPATMTLIDRRWGACDDPALYGARVMVINDFVNGVPNDGHIRVSHVTSSSSGFVVGPIVMTYSELSDTDAEWVYGDGYLWVYEPVDTQRPGGDYAAHGEVLRISETTGAVLQRIQTPWVDRPLLAVDKDGLWIAPADNSGISGSAWGLYRIAPGMTHAVRVNKLQAGTGSLRDSPVNWMVASGHSVWIDLRSAASNRSTFLALNGARGKVTLHTHSNLPLGELGYSEPTITENAATGIWATAAEHAGLGHRIVNLNPTTGKYTDVASITPPDGLQAAVAYHGSLYLLYPPNVTYPGGTTGALIQGNTVIYRITPQ